VGVFGDSKGYCQDNKNGGEKSKLLMVGSNCRINAIVVESNDQ
jgi:hypothetical protein